MWTSKCCQQLRAPKCRRPYGRWYKYTSCLSGTAKCFYAATELYMHVPFIASPMCHTTDCGAGPQSACTEYASGRGGHVLRGCSICVFFVSNEWTIFWCPVTSTTVHITGRFPAEWHTMGNTLVMLSRNTMLATTWTRNREATFCTWPLNWTLLVFGPDSTIIYPTVTFVCSLKKETKFKKLSYEENLWRNKQSQHTLFYLHMQWLPTIQRADLQCSIWCSLQKKLRREIC